MINHQAPAEQGNWRQKRNRCNSENLRKQVRNNGAAQAQDIADCPVRRMIEARVARRPRRERKPSKNHGRDQRHTR